MPGMKALPLPEVLKLLEKLPVKYQALAAIGVTTGCRISEILALRRRDLLHQDGRFREKVRFLLLKKRGKKSAASKTADKKPQRHRVLTIPEDFRPYILRHLRMEEERGYERGEDMVFRGRLGRGLSRMTVYRLFREKLGENCGTHWMRKTFAQELFRYFLCRDSHDPMRALELTRRALGHARLDTTVKYLGITEQNIENAQNDIFKIAKIKER